MHATFGRNRCHTGSILRASLDGGWAVNTPIHSGDDGTDRSVGSYIILHMPAPPRGYCCDVTPIQVWRCLAARHRYFHLFFFLFVLQPWITARRLGKRVGLSSCNYLCTKVQGGWSMKASYRFAGPNSGRVTLGLGVRTPRYWLESFPLVPWGWSSAASA